MLEPWADQLEVVTKSSPQTEIFDKTLGTVGAKSPASQDKAVRLRFHRVNGFFLEDDQSDRFLFRGE